MFIVLGRHCERSEAIQGLKGEYFFVALDCRVAYAPRND